MCDKQSFRDALIRNRAQVCMACFLWDGCNLRRVGKENQCTRIQARQRPAMMPAYARE